MDTTSRDCVWALDSLEAYLDDSDGDLGGSERSRFEAHIAACDRCARELELARACRDELRALPSFEVPPLAVAGAERAARRAVRTIPFSSWC